MLLLYLPFVFLHKFEFAVYKLYEIYDTEFCAFRMANFIVSEN